MARGIGAEAGQVDDCEFGHEAGQLGSLRANQHRADEQIVPGIFVDHPHLDAMFRLRSAEQVGDEQRFHALELGQEVSLERRELLRAHRLVRLAPPYTILGLGILDGELVIGGAAGVLAGLDDDGAILGELALATRNRLFHQRGGGQVPVDRGTRFDSLCIQPVRRGPLAHVDSP